MADPSFRRLDPSGFLPPETSQSGPVPQLLWLAIDELVVDDAYQRPITKYGRVAIQAIADAFEWSRFSPVIVAPIPGEIARYAIIDGQHRTTAAAVCGVTKVPCQVVKADRRQQAAAFSAVNGKVQRISTMQIYHAALEAGEKWAREVSALVDEAGITILRYPMAASDPYRPRHSTMMVRPIQRLMDRHGRQHALLVLRCLTRTPLGDDPVTMGQVWLGAISTILRERKDLADEAGAFAFFGGLDAGECLSRARSWQGYSNMSPTEALTAELRAQLVMIKGAGQ